MDEQHGRTIFIETKDGTLDGWLALPSSPPRGAVIVCPEIFGVTARTRRDAERLAKEGYVVLALNLFYRAAPRADFPTNEEGRARGLALFRELPRDAVIADVGAAIAHVKSLLPSAAGVAILGFSAGGHVAYLAACMLDVRLAVSFYGGWLTGSDIAMSRPSPTIASTPRIAERGARVLYFVGGRDFLITREQYRAIEDQLRTSGVRHDVVVYPNAAHAFAAEGEEHYDAAASEDAWKRTLAALGEELD